MRSQRYSIPLLAQPEPTNTGGKDRRSGRDVDSGIRGAPAGGPRWSGPGRVTLVIGLCAIGLYFLLPGAAAKSVMYSAIGVAATVVVFVAIRIRRPAERAGWYCLGIGTACFVVGDGVYMVDDLVLHRVTPFPSVADVIYLAAYPFLIAGVLRVSRLRGRPGSRESHADAAMVSVAALALSWQFLIGTYAHDTTVSGLGKVVTIAYPVMDIGVFFIVFSALMTAVARRTCDKILALAMLSMLIADFFYDILVLHSAYVGGDPVDVGFLLNYVLLAVAALHPSVADRPVHNTVGGTGRALASPLVALAAFVSPAILLASSVLHLHVDLTVQATASIALVTIGVLRGSWLFGRLRSPDRPAAPPW